MRQLRPLIKVLGVLFFESAKSIHSDVLVHKVKIFILCSVGLSPYMVLGMMLDLPVPASTTGKVHILLHVRRSPVGFMFQVIIVEVVPHLLELSGHLLMITHNVLQVHMSVDRENVNKITTAEFEEEMIRLEGSAG